MTNLQYISAEIATDFIERMDIVTTEQILCDETIVQLLAGSVPQQLSEQGDPLCMMECFLQLFIDREEFEVCKQLVEVHPKLLTTENC
jgi:hypothetical protein